MCMCWLDLFLSKTWGKRKNVIKRWKRLNCVAERPDKQHLLQASLQLAQSV